MRRVVVVGGLAASVAALACASMQAPPGGPKRTTAPIVLTTDPESGAVNVRAKGVIFEFDAIVNDRSGGGDLGKLVLLSPHDEATSVDWHRERIGVRAKHGFRPNTTYSVTLLPGFTDLNNNATKSARTIVFSTGPTIPAFAVHGRVFDWPAERVAVGALVEVVRRSDSLPYVGMSDSVGMFAIGPLEPGTYHVRALLDGNKNRSLDLNEPWDTTGVQVTAESPFVELRAVTRDTVAPKLLIVAVKDSLTLNLSFDRLLDPATPLEPGGFRVVAADSTPVTVVQVMTAARYGVLKASRDSAARDSLARRDTTKRDTVEVGEAVTPAPAPPRPSLPAPTKELILQVDSASRLKVGGTYRVTALGAKGLLGATRTSDRIITVPKPDTTRAVAPAAGPARPDAAMRPKPPERTP